MSNRALAALRTAALFVTTSVVTWLAGRGIVVPDWMQGWIAETILFAGALAAINYAINWLAARQGDGLLARVARWTARVLMLGLSGKQPVYVPPAATVEVDGRTVQ